MIARPALPYLWMLAGALAFAGMGALTHALGPYCDWRVVAICRTALALAFSIGLAKSAAVKLVFWTPRVLWMRSLAGTVSVFCTFYALPRLPVGDVLTLTNIFPLWVAILSWPVLGAVPSPGVWVAIAIGLVGVVLVQQPHFHADPAASLVAVGGSLSTSVAMLGLHKLRGVDARAIVVHFSTVALAGCAAAWAIFPTPTVVQRLPGAEGTMPWGLTPLLLLGVGVTATTGQLFLTKAFAAGAPAKVSVVGLSQAVFGMLFDVAAFGRRIEPTTLVGMGVVMAPIIWLLLRKEKDLAAAADA